MAGLDLAGSHKRRSGHAEIDADLRRLLGVSCLHGGEEIVEMRSRAGVVAIDAPLAPEPVFRELDRLAIRRGYRVLPPSIGGMRLLARGSGPSGRGSSRGGCCDRDPPWECSEELGGRRR